MSRAVLAAHLLLLAACGAPTSPAAPPPAARIVALPSGEARSFDALIDALLDAEVVYVGERHDRVEDHQAQSAIFEALHARDPSIALGLEMVAYPEQPTLDAFVAREIDEPELLARLAWTERWGFDFALYRDAFTFARVHGVPVVALNAPRELTRAVARVGLEGIDPRLRAMLPRELDLDDAAHRAMVEDALGNHPGMDEAMLARFYAAQVVWDETMAGQIAAHLAGADASRRMLVLAGAMHVRAGLGIPKRAAKRGARPHAIVLPIEADELDAAVRARPPIADFLWVIPER